MQIHHRRDADSSRGGADPWQGRTASRGSRVRIDEAEIRTHEDEIHIQASPCTDSRWARCRFTGRWMRSHGSWIRSRGLVNTDPAPC